MNYMEIYKAAQNFIGCYKLKKGYTYEDLKLIAGKQGYSIYEWSNDSLKDENFLKCANCWDVAQTNDGFSFRASDTKIIFIKEILIEQEKKILLLHENIHIFYGHINQNKPLCVSQEKLTTDTHYLIDSILNHKKHILLCLTGKVLIVIFFIVLLICFNARIRVNPHDNVYITPTGHSYHSENCRYGEDYKNSFEINRAVAEEHYLPCDLCNPDKY